MSELTLTYYDEPSGIKEGSVPVAEDAQSFCRLTDVLRPGNTAPQHATFEDGYWVLGKDFRLFPDQPERVSWGIFSRQIADGEGVFAEPIVLALALNALYSAVALSFSFDPYGPTWCCDLHVDWYRAGEIISSGDFQPDAWQYVCYQEVRGFDKVMVTFRRMSKGYRYLKVQALTYGVTRLFDSGELFNLDLIQETDLVSDQVSADTLSFTLRNRSDVGFLFQRKQAMRLFLDGELLGVYYISAHERLKANRYEVSTVDMVGLAEMAGDHMGGIYDNIPAAELVGEILGTIPWRMDPELERIPLSGWLPAASRRDNLRQAAFALCAMVRTARRDCIEITRLSRDEVLRSFEASGRYENGTVATDTRVTEVKVTAHRFTKRQEEEVLYEEVLDGVEELAFSEPVWGLYVTGGELLTSGANFARLSGSGGTVRLTGRKYEHSKRIYSRRNPMVTAGDAEKPVSYAGMTLVSPDNVLQVLESCYAHALRVDRIRGKVLADRETPGDYVSVLTDGGELRRGHLLSLDYVFSGRTAAAAEILADYEGDGTK